MYTRSLIQQHLETLNILEVFSTNVKYIMDKYIIENSVFGSNRKGEVLEMTTGYFVEDKTFENLDDCIKNLKNNQYVQILENEKFITGEIQYSLFNCPNDKKILDLETLQYVR